MYLDKENLYSNDQALTATAVSDDIIDHTIAGIGDGEPVEVLVQVTEDFDAGSVTVALETDDDEAFGTAVTLVQTGDVAAADLTAGYQFALSTMPQHLRSYSRLAYAVTGTPAAGRVTAGLIKDRSAGSF